MILLNAILLFLCLVVMGYLVRHDVADYASFKLLTASRDRQRRYLMWTAKSFVLFTGSTLAALAFLGRLHALAALPPEFQSLAAHAQLPHGTMQNGSFLAGVAGGLVVALLAGSLIGVRLAKARKSAARPFMLGDVQPLLPRNNAETACTALLSINAGLSEELFFRLLLPLLLVHLTGNALAAFLLAALLFGTMHLYQGAKGVLATLFMGLVLTCVYLATRNLWIAVAVHAGIDLVGLVLRPSLGRARRARRGSQTSS